MGPPLTGVLATRSRHWKVRFGLRTVNRPYRYQICALWVRAQQAEVRLMARQRRGHDAGLRLVDLGPF
jgi:hypothetical protein